MIAIIYQFTLHEGKEKLYHALWQTVANYFMSERGAIGSCLHKNSEGLWVAYSRWPDYETWQATWRTDDTINQELPAEIQDAISQMSGCIKEKLPELLLDVVDDLLVKK